jgi:two-component system sensor histidine kinase KdpD
LAEHGDDLDKAARRRLARSIEAKARDMTDLVANVLDLMRFESGQVALRREWETLDDLLGTALIRMQERLGSHEVTSQLPADLPPVHVDANLIVQVFVNLLDNVVKYTPPETSVTISAVVRDDAVAVTCDDSGPGLPAGEASRLFDKFQRGNDEGATVGAGLGLAICRAIVRAHGGDITAGARPGGGARFVFTLPLKEGSS